MGRLITTIGIWCIVIVLSGVAAAQMPGNRGQRAPTSSVPIGDPAMEAAFETARATLGDFLNKLANPPAHTRGYSVKILLIEPGRQHEYIWVSGLVRRGNRVGGRIANEPRWVSNVRLGQVVDVDRSEIYDWMYLDDDKQRMFGNFTLCALLTHKTAQEAAQTMQEYGLECDSERPVNR